MQDIEHAYLNAIHETSAFIAEALTFNAGERPTTESRKFRAPSKYSKLTEHITAILNDPDTPEDIMDGIIRALQELNDDGNIHMRPDYVEAILVQHAEGEDEEGGQD